MVSRRGPTMPTPHTKCHPLAGSRQRERDKGSQLHIDQAKPPQITPMSKSGRQPIHPYLCSHAP